MLSGILSRKKLITAVGYLLIGGLVGFGAARVMSENIPDFTLTLSPQPGLPFVRPMVGLRTPASYNDTVLAPLREAIKEVGSAAPGALTRYAYYFRDLTNASWVGVHEDDRYNPASMLKVVAALAVYRQSEIDPTYLETPLTYTPELAKINAAFPFAPTVSLEVGESYSVRHLLELMLTDSDNAAKDLLLSSLDQRTIDQVYSDLSIPKPSDTDSSSYTISPLEYSRFLRVLYYGIFNISWKNDNLLLGLLSKSTFTDGIVAGVPHGTVVAHKYGQHIAGSASTSSNQIELSDCGIVYSPRIRISSVS